MYVYLNGEYIEKDRAVVSIDDRGFLFADGLYEMILSYGGKPFRMERHLRRLARGLDFLKITCAEFDQVSRICAELLARNHLTNEAAAIYLQITRGAAPRSHGFPGPAVRPTLYLAARPFQPNLNDQRHGIPAITVPDIRWGRCDIKTIALLPNVLAHQRAIEAGAKEAVFERDGFIMEGTHSNIFAVMNGELITPPLSEHILPGITREAVLEIAEKAGLKCDLRPLKLAQARAANELFITSTTLEITPVIKLDEVKISEGQPGPITVALQRRFQNLVAEECGLPIPPGDPLA